MAWGSHSGSWLSPIPPPSPTFCFSEDPTSCSSHIDAVGAHCRPRFSACDSACEGHVKFVRVSPPAKTVSTRTWMRSSLASSEDGYLIVFSAPRPRYVRVLFDPPLHAIWLRRWQRMARSAQSPSGYERNSRSRCGGPSTGLVGMAGHERPPDFSVKMARQQQRVRIAGHGRWTTDLNARWAL